MIQGHLSTNLNICFENQNECEIRLEGENNLGMKQGDYYYLLNDGTKKYAGRYQNNKKEGTWLDHVGYERRIHNSYLHFGSFIQQKRQIYVKNEYHNDQKLGTCDNSKGRVNQNGLKEGYWLEKSGTKHQMAFGGQYKSNIREGEWQYIFQGRLIGQGCYNQFGQKTGIWTQPHEKYDKHCKIIFSGEYRNDQQFGTWTIFNKGEKIGGGDFEDDGKKSGNWTDIHDNFYEWCQVTYSGQYRNGARFGTWTTFYKGEKIGGGDYGDNGEKSGNWIDLHDNFSEYNLLNILAGVRQPFKVNTEMVYGLANGLFYLKGRRCNDFRSNSSGGGKYEENGVKSGKWIDVHDNFSDYSQTTQFEGEYKKGFRIGIWTTYYKGKKIGGGNYEENSMKSGNWIDLHDKYSDLCGITFSGQYINGLRIGEWITFNRGQKIGGGHYQDNGVKSGNWIDLHEDFWDLCQTTFLGEYKNGIRNGMWTSFYCGKKIGGGNYEENGQKSGDWIDLHENFWDRGQVTFFGEYRNGFRIGTWTTSYDGQKMGGGNYEENEMKSGNWINLHEDFWENCLVTFSGEYRNSLRVGSWTTVYCSKKIGGGYYDEKEVKSGNWIDIHDYFSDECQIIFTGQYTNGQRVGIWTTLYKEKKIGGGKYEEKEVKSEKWIDLHDAFNEDCQITYSGEYKNGFRIGAWTTFYKGKKIGGGNYEEYGQKSGNWIDLHKKYQLYKIFHYFYPFSCYQITFSGKYRNGLRIGTWIELKEGKKQKEIQYDEKGIFKP